VAAEKMLLMLMLLQRFQKTTSINPTIRKHRKKQAPNYTRNFYFNA